MMGTESMEEFDYERMWLARDEETDPECFPHLGTISARFFFRFLPIPHGELRPPEYVYIKYPSGGSKDALRSQILVSDWNCAWESADLNRHIHESRLYSRDLRWLKQAQGRNIRLVPRRDRWHLYDAYAPLYHLLPRKTLQIFGLPLLKRGLWPFTSSLTRNRVIPLDFVDRLADAFSLHIWPLLSPGSPRSAFSRKEPLVTLSHNLDFWLPYIDLVAQRRARDLGRTVPEDKDIADLGRMNAAAQDDDRDFSIAPPAYGGTLWLGEDEALEATREMIAVADEHGRLAELIDAVRSNRVEDDFSSKWSCAREDFERKLYHKRLTIKPVFVELPDTIPVHGPQSELDEDRVWEDFLAFVDAKDRRVVVCLRSGQTKVADIASELGYANHSPVSKALSRIRQKAKAYFST